MSPCWEIHGNIDSTAFFHALPEHFPECTTIYIETTGVDSEILNLYLSHQEPGPYLADTQTLWPKPVQTRCRFSKEFCSQLESLTLNHAEPELLDHLSLYSDSSPLLVWPDAFTDPPTISPTISESRVAAFAQELGAKHVFNQRA